MDHTTLIDCPICRFDFKRSVATITYTWSLGISKKWTVWQIPLQIILGNVLAFPLLETFGVTLKFRLRIAMSNQTLLRFLTFQKASYCNVFHTAHFPAKAGLGRTWHKYHLDVPAVESSWAPVIHIPEVEKLGNSVTSMTEDHLLNGWKNIKHISDTPDLKQQFWNCIRFLKWDKT